MSIPSKEELSKLTHSEICDRFLLEIRIAYEYGVNDGGQMMLDSMKPRLKMEKRKVILLISCIFCISPVIFFGLCKYVQFFTYKIHGEVFSYTDENIWFHTILAFVVCFILWGIWMVKILKKS